ncbi:flagellar assembly peptidoglycan hydrolase FlgJ [Halomonas shantousis]
MSMGDLSSQFALDMQGMQRLKHTAKTAPEKGVQEAARQFEAVFLQMMLKSMRDASPQSGLLNSQQSQFYTSMQDQQWAQHLAGRGLGLAEQIVSQLESSGLVPGASSSDNLIAGIPRGTPRVLHDGLRSDLPALDEEIASLAALDEVPGEPEAPGERYETDIPASPVNRAPHVEAFLSKLQTPAQVASRTTGVPAELILAQAALETGWGSREIPTADGGNSHNLFGIKAGSRWDGEVTEITTTEYIDGRPRKVVDAFRVYDSFEEAFTDYARLIGNNPRYAGVVTAATPHEAARALQAGGYATDPKYADKLISIMAQVDDGTLPARAVASNDAATAKSPFSIERNPTQIF